MEKLVHEFWMPLAALCFAALVICLNRLMAERVECPQCGLDDTFAVEEWDHQEGRKCRRCNFGWTRNL